jgi:NADPH:quinone reductase-like Zn-dependent oxidoreductase
VETVLSLTDDHGVDHVLELVGGTHLSTAVQVVAVGARIHQIGGLEGYEVAAPSSPLMLKSLTIPWHWRRPSPGAGGSGCGG